MSGLTVYANLSGDGSGDPSNPFTTTGMDGSFTLTLPMGLAPGTVVSVCIVAPSGNWQDTSGSGGGNQSGIRKGG